MTAATFIDRLFMATALALAAAALIAAVSGAAHAQQACGDRGAIIKVLATKYKELPKSFGIASDRNLVELFVSKTGSWTVLETLPQGVTCVVRSGQSWEDLPSEKTPL